MRIWFEMWQYKSNALSEYTTAVKSYDKLLDILSKDDPCKNEIYFYNALCIFNIEHVADR